MQKLSCISFHNRVDFCQISGSRGSIPVRDSTHILFLFLFLELKGGLHLTCYRKNFSGWRCCYCELLGPKGGDSVHAPCVRREYFRLLPNNLKMAGETTVLLVTDKPSLPGTVVMWAMQKFEDKAKGGKGMTVVTNILQAGGKIAAESLSINVVISLAATPGHHNTAWLTEVARVLRPGGEFWLQEPLMSRDVAPEEKSHPGFSALQTITSLERNLILSGFLGSKSFESVEDIGLAESYQAITPVSVGSISGPLLKPMALQVQKPNWELGSAFTLKKRTLAPKDTTAKTLNSVQKEVTVHSRAAVKFSSEDVTDDVIPLAKSWNWSPDVDLDELIDEDELLTEDDLRRPELPVGDDCNVEKVGKKACKNCSCGRVELEEKKVSSVLTASQINNPQSACGNCGLGDAFRCNGCPYRGQPPFKLGEKITLSSSLLVADA